MITTSFIRILKQSALQLFFPAMAMSQQGLYTIQFQNTNSQTVSMAQFAGKKLVVSIINAAAPDELYMKQLDSLQRTYSNKVSVIAIPVTNFGSALSNDSLVAISTRLNLSYIISIPAKGKRSDNAQQHPLLSWLTNLSQNARFDRDVEEPGQMFVISKQGILFAVIKNRISPTESTINRLIMEKSPD